MNARTAAEGRQPAARRAIGIRVGVAALATAGVLVSAGAASAVEPVATRTVPVAAASSGSTAGKESSVFTKVNSEREKRNRKPVKRLSRLDQVARQWAKEMATSGFRHSTSSWRSGKIPGGWSMFGENIAAGQTTSGEVMDAWMDSPGHKANIIEKGYNYIGIGYYRDPDSQYGTYWVQMFAKY